MSDDARRADSFERYRRWDPELKDRPAHIWTAGYAAGVADALDTPLELCACGAVATGGFMVPWGPHVRCCSNSECGRRAARAFVEALDARPMESRS